MNIERFRTGGDRNLAYLVVDATTGAAAAIDPSYRPEELVDFAASNGLALRLAFCTHGHSDHTNGNAQFERLTGIRPLLFGDVDPRSGRHVGDGTVFRLGSVDIEVLHTPGHSPDSICLVVDGAAFTGDTLFVGKVGGTGFGDDARAEYDSLHGRLLTLPDATRVLPGHDVGVLPESTIGAERDSNPFLLQPDFESFLHLKRTWADYKKEHGIA